MATLRQHSITIPSSGVDADLTDFTFMLTRDMLHDEVVSPTGANRSQSDGGDLLFFSDSEGTTQLPCDICWWEYDTTEGAGDAQILVAIKIPSLTATGGGEFYIQYNSTESGVQPDATGTYGQYNAYDSNWWGFWPDADITDRTSNSYTMTRNGTNAASPSAPLASLKGTDLWEGTESREITQAPTGYPVTLMGWKYPRYAQYSSKLGGFYDASASNVFYTMDGRGGTAGDPVLPYLQNGATVVAPNGLNPGYTFQTWQQWTMRLRENNNRDVYINESKYTPTAQTCTWNSNTDSFSWGAIEKTSRFNGYGYYSMIAVHDTDRNDAWVNASYRQINDPASFGSPGTPENLTSEHTASGSVSTNSSTNSASATFSNPVYDGDSAVSIGNVTNTASATFTNPVYTASSAVTVGNATAAGIATHTTPVFTASSAVTVGNATAAGIATHTTPVFTASSAVTANNATVAGTATNTNPVYTALNSGANFNNSNFLYTSSPPTLDTTEYRIDVVGTMIRNGNRQFLCGVAGASSTEFYAFFLTSAGELELDVADSGDVIQTVNLATIPNAEDIDLSIYIRCTSDEIEIVDNIGSIYDDTISQSITDSPSSTYFIVGGWFFGFFSAMEAATLARVATYTSGDVPQHEWLVSESVVDQVDSKNLTEFGSVFYLMSISNVTCNSTGITTVPPIGSMGFWSDFTDSDYLVVDDGTTYPDTTEFRIDVKFRFLKSFPYSSQSIIAQGIADARSWSIQTFNNGQMYLYGKQPSSSPMLGYDILNGSLTVGEEVDLTIYIRCDTNQIQVIDNIGGIYDRTRSATLSSYTDTESLYIGRAKVANNYCEGLKIRYVAMYTDGDVLQNEWNFAVDSITNFSTGTDLTITGNPSYVSGIILNNITAGGTATNTNPVYTASSAVTVGNAIAAGTATNTNPVYTASLAVTTNNTTAAGTATHTTPVYTAGSTITIGNITANGSATNTNPVYTASSALTINNITNSSSATFTAPVYTASSAVSITDITNSASGINTNPVYTSSSALTTSNIGSNTPSSATGITFDFGYSVGGDYTDTWVQDETYHGWIWEEVFAGDGILSLTYHLFAEPDTIPEAIEWIGYTQGANDKFDVVIAKNTGGNTTYANALTGSTGTTIVTGVWPITSLNVGTGVNEGKISVTFYSDDNNSIIYTDYLAATFKMGEATFTSPVYTASSAVSINNITASATGTFKPLNTGSSAVTINNITNSGDATFSAPIYDGTSAVTITNVFANSTGTHVTPVYNGTSAVSINNVVASGIGVYAAGIFLGSSAVSIGNATALSTGTVTAPIYDGTSAVSITNIASSSSATFTAPVNTASSAVTINNVTASTSGTFVEESYDGTGILTIGNTTASGTATHITPVFTSSSAVSIGSAYLSEREYVSNTSIAYFKLDETTTTSTAINEKGTDGTFVNIDPYNPLGIDNVSRGFTQDSGYTKYIAFDNKTLTFDSDFTISALVNMDGFTSEYNNVCGNIFSSDHRWQILSPTGVRVRCGTTTSTWNPGTTISTGIWQSLVLRRNAGVLQLFISGVATPTTVVNTGQFSVDAIGAGGSNYAFLGRMSDVRFYNSSLDAEEISGLGDYTLAPITETDNPSLVSWFPLEENSSTQNPYDVIDSGNTTTLPGPGGTYIDSNSDVPYSVILENGFSYGTTGIRTPFDALNSGIDITGGTIQYPTPRITNGIAPGSLAAIRFNGEDQYISGLELEMHLNDWSVSVYFQTTNTALAGIAGVGEQVAVIGRYAIYHDTTVHGFISDGSTDFSVDATGTTSDGQIHHAVMTCDRDGDMSLYVDGILNDTVDISSISSVDMDSPDLTFDIGHYNLNGPTPGNFFSGIIDEVTVYNYLLTPSQISGFSNSTNSYATFSISDYASSGTISIGNITNSGIATFTSPVYTASSALTINNIINSGNGTFTPPVYTASTAASISNTVVSGIATFAAEVYSGSATNTITNIISTSTATFEVPVHTGSSAITINNVVSSGDATFLTPSYTGSSANTINNVISSGNATFATAVFLGSSAVTTNNTTASGNASVTTPVYTAASANTINNVISSGNATFNAPVFTASSAISLANITATGTAIFAAEVYSGTSSVSITNLTASGNATFVAPISTGSSAVSVGSVTASGNAQVTNPSYTASCAVSIGNVTCNSSSTFDNFYTATANLNTNSTQVSGEATFELIGNINILGLYINSIGDDGVSSMIETNLKLYYDWAFLNIGAWSEVDIPTTQGYGGDYSRLRPVNDPNYTDGRVWEAARKDFVWEPNISYIDTTGGIISPSAVGVPYVNSSPTNQGYYINYPMGQVIFDYAQSTSDVVQLEYPYRTIQIYLERNIPDWQELQFRSHRMDSSQFLQFGSGEWSTFAQHRVQMPMIIIKTRNGTSEGWELGAPSNRAIRDIEFHVLAENRYDRNNIIDIINLQNNRKVPFLDIQEIVNDSVFPLDYRGELVGNSGYEDFTNVSQYRWNMCSMKKSQIIDIGQIHPNLYHGIVRTTMSIIV